MKGDDKRCWTKEIKRCWAWMLGGVGMKNRRLDNITKEMRRGCKRDSRQERVKEEMTRDTGWVMKTGGGGKEEMEKAVR